MGREFVEELVSNSGLAANRERQRLGLDPLKQLAGGVNRALTSVANTQSISTSSAELRAIAAGVADLSLRQASVLAQLGGFNSRVIIPKNGFENSDFAALSAATGTSLQCSRLEGGA